MLYTLAFEAYGRFAITPFIHYVISALTSAGGVMYFLQKLGYIADHHHPKWIDYFRIITGLILIVKGVAFIDNKDEVILMIGTGLPAMLSFFIAHYVIAAFIAGGIAITAGMFTRLAVITVLPAVAGAIIFIDLHKGLFALNSQLVYSVLLLAILLFFLFYGSGKLSLDSYLENKT